MISRYNATYLQRKFDGENRKTPAETHSRFVLAASAQYVVLGEGGCGYSYGAGVLSGNDSF